MPRRYAGIPDEITLTALSDTTMSGFISTDLSDLGLPIRLEKPILQNSARNTENSSVRLRIASRSLNERITSLTGRAAEQFEFSTRLCEFQVESTDEVLVEDSKGSRFPLVVRRGKDIILNFDLEAAEGFKWDDSTRPIYTYLPGFNIQRIPPLVRRPISNLLQARSSRRVGQVNRDYGQLPLRAFEFLILLLALAVTGDTKGRQSAFRWPEGRRAVFVPFHDVDTAGFLRRRDRDPLFLVEQKHGVRSTWFVPTAYLGNNREHVRFLLQTGNEIGWHGHNHDHRLPYSPFAEQRVRILKESWLCGPENHPTGMRTPKLLKSNHLFHLLDRGCDGLRYDTSFLRGIVPYDLWVHGRRTRILEIPITVPTDIVVWNALGDIPTERRAAAVLDAQVKRTEKLIEAGGIISIVTHPERDLSERPELLDVYDQYLAYIKRRQDVSFMTGGELFKYWSTHRSQRLDDQAHSNRTENRLQPAPQ